MHRGASRSCSISIFTSRHVGPGCVWTATTRARVLFQWERERFPFSLLIGGGGGGGGGWGGGIGEMSKIGQETVTWMWFVDKMESLIQNMEAKSFGSSEKAGALVLVLVELQPFRLQKHTCMRHPTRTFRNTNTTKRKTPQEAFDDNVNHAGTKCICSVHNLFLLVGEYLITCIL